MSIFIGCMTVWNHINDLVWYNEFFLIRRFEKPYSHILKKLRRMKDTSIESSQWSQMDSFGGSEHQWRNFYSLLWRSSERRLEILV